MKKTGLFKIIMFVLLGIMVISWIFSASYFSESIEDLGMFNVGLFNGFKLLLNGFIYPEFVPMALFLLSVGAFYGVLVKTGKYRALVEKIAKAFKGAELIFLLIVAFLVSLLTSLFDYQLLMFMFFPFLISIILFMGYDRITAMLATVGALLVGKIGSTFSYNTSGIVSELVSAKVTDGLLYRFIILVLCMAVLFAFLTKAKRSKNIDAEDQLFAGEKEHNKHSVAIVITMLSVLFVIFILGCTNWYSIFKIETFNNFNTAVNEFSVKLPYLHITPDGISTGSEKVQIFEKVLGGATALGNWEYAEMTMVLLLASVLTGLLYGFKFKKTFSYMGEGALKMIKPAMLVLLTYVVLFFAGNTMFYGTIEHLILGLTKKFSIFTSMVSSVLGSALFVDMKYVANYVLPEIVAFKANSNALTVIIQGAYGVTMLLVPTSAFLALGLSYIGISYKDWVKKTWLFTLILFAIIVIASVVINYAL